MKKVLFVLVFTLIGLQYVHGDGRLEKPLGRSSLYRYLASQYPADTFHPNFDDVSLNCGGQQNNGQNPLDPLNPLDCGVCGDDPALPTTLRDNSYINSADPSQRGKYVTGIPGYLFEQGREVDFVVYLSSGSMGYFIFEICSLPNSDTEVTEQCFADGGALQFSSSSTSSNTGTVVPGTRPRYILPVQDGSLSGQNISVTVQLPPTMTCEYCVIRWIWIKQNCDVYNCYGTRKGATFINCADVEILSPPAFNASHDDFKYPLYNDPYASISGGHVGDGHGLDSGGLGGNTVPVITNPTTKSTSATTKSTTSSNVVNPTTKSTTLNSGGLGSPTPPLIVDPTTKSTTAQNGGTTKTTTLQPGAGLGGDTTHKNWHATTKAHNWHTTTKAHNWHTTSKAHHTGGGSRNNGFDIRRLILLLSLLGLGWNSAQPTGASWIPYYWQPNTQYTGYSNTGSYRPTTYTGYGQTSLSGYGSNRLPDFGQARMSYGYQGYGQGQTYKGYGQGQRYTGYGQGQHNSGNRQLVRHVSNTYQNTNPNYNRATNLIPPASNMYQVPASNIPNIPRRRRSAHGTYPHREDDVEPQAIRNPATTLHRVEKISTNDIECAKSDLVCHTKPGLDKTFLDWICVDCTNWLDQPCPPDICQCKCQGNPSNTIKKK